jgi:Protein of unknown function (DUF2892)
VFFNKNHNFFIIKNSIFMKVNMGSTDKLIRLVVAAVAGVLYFTGTISGTLGIIGLVVAGIFALTSVVSFCPLYALVGISSCPVKK